MLTLMNYWNAVWRSNMAEIEDSFRRRRDSEDLAFRRQMQRGSRPRWQRRSRILRYDRPRPPANG